MGIPETLSEIQAKLLELETKIDADKIVYTKCASCNAEGITGIEVGCDACNQTGFRAHGKIGRIQEG